MLTLAACLSAFYKTSLKRHTSSLFIKDTQLRTQFTNICQIQYSVQICEEITYYHWRAKFLKYTNMSVLEWSLQNENVTEFLSRSILGWGWWKGKMFLKRKPWDATENKNIHWITRLHPEIKITRKWHQEYVCKSLDIRNTSEAVSF